MSEETRVLGPDDVRRAITRMAHEIVERNRGPVVVLGIQRGGVWIADALVEELSRIGHPCRAGSVDPSLHRDDIGLRPIVPGAVSEIPAPIEDDVVVLVDDVLFTGRTVRAALDAVSEYGRPRAVQLAVLVDRGHRELPLRPDYIGKNLPTHRDQEVEATADGVVITNGTAEGGGPQ